MTHYLPYTIKEYMALLFKELKEYEAEIGGMTAEERKQLRKWVADGGSVCDNPWGMCADNDHSIDYITAIRIIDDIWYNPDDYFGVSKTAPDALDDNIPF
jgi:hypothetical protein